MFPNINEMKIYLVCSKTDLRKGIDGLAALVLETFDLDVYDNAIFLFCGTRADRFKALYWDKTGFVLYYKRIDNGHFQWPRKRYSPLLLAQASALASKGVMHMMASAVNLLTLTSMSQQKVAGVIKEAGARVNNYQRQQEVNDIIG